MSLITRTRMIFGASVVTLLMATGCHAGVHESPIEKKERIAADNAVVLPEFVSWHDAYCTNMLSIADDLNAVGKEFAGKRGKFTEIGTQYLDKLSGTTTGFTKLSDMTVGSQGKIAADSEVGQQVAVSVTATEKTGDEIGKLTQQYRDALGRIRADVVGTGDNRDAVNRVNAGLSGRIDKATSLYIEALSGQPAPNPPNTSTGEAIKALDSCRKLTTLSTEAQKSGSLSSTSPSTQPSQGATVTPSSPRSTTTR